MKMTIDDINNRNTLERRVSRYLQSTKSVCEREREFAMLLDNFLFAQITGSSTAYLVLYCILIFPSSEGQNVESRCCNGRERHAVVTNIKQQKRTREE